MMQDQLTEILNRTNFIKLAMQFIIKYQNHRLFRHIKCKKEVSSLQEISITDYQNKFFLDDI